MSGDSRKAGQEDKAQNVDNKNTVASGQAPKFIDGLDHPSQSVQEIYHLIKQQTLSEAESPQETIAKKMTPELIAKSLDLADKADERASKIFEKRDSKYFWSVISILAFVLILVGIIVFSKNTEHLDAVIAAIVGLGGGFGIGKWHSATAGE